MIKKKSLGVLVLALVMAVSLISCKTIDSLGGGINRTQGSFDDMNLVPAKDYRTLGLVFSEATYQMDEKGERGNVLVYQMLLKEAQALGADTVVNVVIDYKISGSQKKLFGIRPVCKMTGQVTWYGSATAIKYTDTIKLTTTERTFNNDGNVSVTTTSETLVRNSAASGGVFGGGSSKKSGGLSGLINKLFKK